MQRSISTASANVVRYRSRGVGFDAPEGESVYDRFSRIPGTNQAALTQAHMVLVGCGGLGGEVGHGLIRKGVGRLTFCDHDVVELSNLPRQHFGVQDLGQNKALALARNLAAQATGQSLIEGHSHSFQETLARGVSLVGSVAIVGVDNQATRLEAAAYYHELRIPAIFLAVDVTASRGYVFVQTSRPGAACFQCLFPEAASDNRIYGCAGASIEILKVVAGVALYAIDSLLMDRSRPWTYKEIFLDHGGDGQRLIGQRSECSLCGGV